MTRHRPNHRGLVLASALCLGATACISSIWVEPGHDDQEPGATQPPPTEGAGPTPPETPGVPGPPSPTQPGLPQPPPIQPGGAWRPFGADSPWNTPIADGAPLDPDSTTMIADFVTASPFGSFLGINIDDFSIPLFWVDPSTPQNVVSATIGGLGFSGNDGRNATAVVPIPGDAAADPQSDHHMLIVDRQNALEWGFYGAARQGAQWTCKLCATSDLNGSGVRPPETGNATWFTSHGPRACGFPLIAGLIRTEEIEAGQIEHALVIAYPHIRAGLYTSPASTAQARIGNDAIKTRGIPCGGRIQLDPNLDLESLALSASGKTIARALQKYGAYVGDYSGSMSLYAENDPRAMTYWNAGKLGEQELRDKIELESFRVLALGPLLDDGNGG